jgi:negative regulator of replication initiation
MKIELIHKNVPQPVLLPPTYGVWIRGRGWLNPDPHGNPATAYTDTSRRVAVSVARRVGGRVEYIDKSLVALEDILKRAEYEREQQNIVRRFMRWLKEIIHELSRRYHQTIVAH